MAGETRIKIMKNRRPTVDQLRTALRLAESRGDVTITLVDPDTNVSWATASVNDVAAYVAAIDNVKWPFVASGNKRSRVVIE